MSILIEYEKILEDQPDPCLDICRSFLSNDSEAFSDALVEFLEKYETRFANHEKAERILPELAATEGRLCVEALALVKLAEAKGFDLEEDYLFIPSTAREKTSITFYPNDWKHPQ